MFNIIRLKQVASTNSYLRELATEQMIPSFTVVIAEHQFAGKGQGCNTWVSNSGENLTCSLYYDATTIGFENIFVLNKCIALNVRTLINEIVPDRKVFIKWPNDILVDDRKIAGILIENSLMNSQLKSVIGVGININQTEFQKMNVGAVSLKQLTNKIFNTEDVLMRFLELLYDELQIIHKSSSQNRIAQRYNEFLYRLNETRSYYLHDKKIRGAIIGVDVVGNVMFKPEFSSEILHLEHGYLRFCI
jgi:BirA family biotin operon repressor/biotin-[acetyl-CoA-carboxylase] ligase